MHTGDIVGLACDKTTYDVAPASVLELHANGITTKAIAVQLGVSNVTVKKHVGTLSRRYTAPNRALIVGAAMRAGELS
jgi:DNA-binding NarL/FixJ family response regulator